MFCCLYFSIGRCLLFQQSLPYLSSNLWLYYVRNISQVWNYDKKLLIFLNDTIFHILIWRILQFEMSKTNILLNATLFLICWISEIWLQLTFYKPCPLLFLVLRFPLWPFQIWWSPPWLKFAPLGLWRGASTMFYAIQCH